MNTAWRRYLLWFAQEHIEFRFQEIESLLSMLQIKMNYMEKPDPVQPYWIVEFKSEEDARRLTNRSVSLRNCIELWGYSDSTQGLHNELRAFPADVMSPYLEPNKSFKIDVETFCKHFTQKEKVEKLETLDYLPFKGPVRLKDPDVCFQYIEYYGVDPVSPPENPYAVFFGRWIANGLRQLIKRLSLKTRKFIGNTSMDAQLSLLMANQAQVRDGDLVLDPFVGSGSLLVAAAQFGGYVWGTDIDYLMLHARTRPSRITQQTRDTDEGVKANLQQYNSEKNYLDVMINDFAVSFWKDGLEFDSIIADPPYGIREATERIGTTKENYTISESHLKTHIPAKIDYGISQLYYDLLNFAAKHLKSGGRLVCWFPVFRGIYVPTSVCNVQTPITDVVVKAKKGPYSERMIKGRCTIYPCSFREDYTESGLPQHSSLELIANSEQVLNKHTSRRLLTYVKTETTHASDDSGEENTIQDFRARYYETREETRNERRTKQAQLRERGRLEAEKRRLLNTTVTK